MSDITQVVLSRRQGESVKILTSDGVVEVTVGDRSGSRTKLIVSGPRHIPFVRGELLVRDVPAA